MPRTSGRLLVWVGVVGAACAAPEPAPATAPHDNRFAAPPPDLGDRAPPVEREERRREHHRDTRKTPPPKTGECTARVVLPERMEVGTYPDAFIEFTPPLRGSTTPPPKATLHVRQPDGTDREQTITLMGQSTCAYCLPAPGSGGCEHSCTYDPVAQADFGLSRVIKAPGRHRYTVTLQGLKCVLDHDRGTIVAVPRTPRP